MSFKYKFTVYTLCYNSEKVLHRAFNSLINQTLDHKDFEWIVINDASTDNTDKLIMDFIKRADFDVKYFNLKKNQMVIKNIKLAIDNAEGELIVGLAHDDECLSTSLEFFWKVWENLDENIKEKCVSIVCLSQDQYGNPIGSNYPKGGKFITSLDYVFKLNFRKIGENWGAIRTEFMKKFYKLPKELDELIYIPESYFWNKMALDMYKEIGNTYTYLVNNRLRIYYKEDGREHLSHNIRKKYYKGFKYESLYFLNNYQFLQIKKSPKFFIKHLLKYIFISTYEGLSLGDMLKPLKNRWVKILLILFYPLKLLNRLYFK